MLTQDGPQFPDWDQDATAVEDRYGEQDPVVVAGELATAAEVIAAHFDGLAPDQWQRTGSRSDGPISLSSPSGGTSSTTQSIISGTSPAPGKPASRSSSALPAA